MIQWTKKGICKLVGKYWDKENQKLLKKVHGSAHDVLVGSWAGCWVRNTGGAILSSAIMPKGKMSEKRFADIIFAYNKKFVGVGEYENHHENLKIDLDVLSSYAKAKNEFRTLKFVLLSTYAYAERNGDYERKRGGEYTVAHKRIRKTINKCKTKSQSSKLFWILHISKWARGEEAFVGGERCKHYMYHCAGMEWFIFRNGKEVEHKLQGIGRKYLIG